MLRGSSIEDLSRSWTYSTSLKEVLFSLKHFNVIALATLATKLTLIDSSLMQRATSTYTAWEQPKTVSDITGMNRCHPSHSSLYIVDPHQAS